jgi:hypothetical protein
LFFVIIFGSGWLKASAEMQVCVRAAAHVCVCNADEQAVAVLGGSSATTEAVLDAAAGYTSYAPPQCVA